MNILLSEWKSFDAAEKKELSVIEYEIGYLEYMLGNTDESAKVLFDGARHAEEAGDPVGKLINSFCAYNSLYQGRKLSIHEAGNVFEQHRVKMIEQEALKPREQRVIGWLLNIAYRLFEIACEEGNERKAQKFAEEVQRNELVQRNKNDVNFRLTQKNVAARLATVKSDWEDALRNWASFLDIDLPGLEKYIEQDLVEFHRISPEQTLCYREAGTALRQLGHVDIACRIWQRGLECPGDAGNKFYKTDIQTLMQQYC